MKRFLIAAALALTGALGFADSAHAQYVYGYNNNVVPGVGVVGNRTYVTPFGAQSLTQSYSPYSGLTRQSYYTDVFGNQTTRFNTYNPYTNYGYSRGYTTSPNVFGAPVYRNYYYGYRR